jgi:hypothetical protein
VWESIKPGVTTLLESVGLWDGDLGCRSGTFNLAVTNQDNAVLIAGPAIVDRFSDHASLGMGC